MNYFILMATRDTPLEGASVQIPGESKPTRKRIKKSPPIAVQEFKLTLNQSKFIAEYIHNGGNATRAYMIGFSRGYSTSKTEAHKLLKIPEIIEEIEVRKEKFLESLNYNREKHIRILVAIATSTPQDFIGIDKSNPDHVARLGDLIYAMDAGTWDRRAARDELSRIFGFDKPSDSGNSEALDACLLAAAQKVINGQQNK